MEREQLQLLIYQHVVSLTLIDYAINDAFAIAYQVAEIAFDADRMEAGLTAAREALAAEAAAHVATPAPRVAAAAPRPPAASQPRP